MLHRKNRQCCIVQTAALHTVIKITRLRCTSKIGNAPHRQIAPANRTGKMHGQNARAKCTDSFLTFSLLNNIPALIRPLSRVCVPINKSVVAYADNVAFGRNGCFFPFYVL